MTPVLPYHVRTTVEHRPVSGADSAIVSVPEGLYVKVGNGPPALDIRALGRMLREVSEVFARDIGETLHHADWTITGDPAMVEEVGMHGRPDCMRCRSSVDQALAYLAEAEGRTLLVGALYWAG